MRTFSLKDGRLIDHPGDESSHPGRTIHPEPLRMAEPGWVQHNYAQGEFVQRRDDVIEQEELDAAREWLRHVEAGRIGTKHRA